MKKRLLFFTFLLLILTSLVFVSFNLQSKDAISVKDFILKKTIQGENVKVIGDISDISTESFTIRDIEFPEDEITYQSEENLKLDSFGLGQTVLVDGIYEETNSEIKVISIEKIDKIDALRHLDLQKPLLEITILNYQEEVEDKCQDIDFKIKIKNASKREISYEDIYDERFGYAIAYILNENSHLYFYIEDFETLKPGEEKELIWQKEVDLKEKMIQGENSLQFAWVQKSLYDEDVKALNASEKVKLIVKSTECE